MSKTKEMRLKLSPAIHRAIRAKAVNLNVTNSEAVTRIVREHALDDANIMMSLAEARKALGMDGDGEHEYLADGTVGRRVKS